jgi:hypothetical protein
MELLIRPPVIDSNTGITGHQYASICRINPFLVRNILSLEVNIFILAFSARVRTGFYGRGNQVHISTVTTALVAISKTIQLAGELSPIYWEKGKYKVSIARMVKGFRRLDPPTTPQLAVPVAVPNACFTAGQLSDDPITKAADCLALIMLYFLLRVSEFTKPRMVIRNGTSIRATRTVQFTIGNVGFSKMAKTIGNRTHLTCHLNHDPTHCCHKTLCYFIPF